MSRSASRSGNYAYYNDYVFLYGFDTPGTYRVNVSADWWDDSASADRTVEKSLSFSLRRPTSLTYNASPEPVKRGAYLTNAGVLKFDPYGYGPAESFPVRRGSAPNQERVAAASSHASSAAFLVAMPSSPL